MAYATVMHVEAKCLARAPFTNKPSASQVVQYLRDVSAIVDSALYQAEYSVPVPMGTTSVSSSAQQFLEDVNAQGAAWYVERYAPQSNREKDFQLAFETSLNMIRTSGIPGHDRDSPIAFPRFSPPCPTPAFTLEMQL